MFFNIFLASLTFFLFKAANDVLGNNIFTVRTHYRSTQPTEVVMSDAMVSYYAGFLFIMGVIFLLVLFWSNFKQRLEDLPAEEKTIRKLDVLGASVVLNSITPILILSALLQEHVSGTFYGAIVLLLVVELYFKRVSSITLSLSLLLLYLSDGTEYTFLLNGAIIFLMLSVASRLVQSVYGKRPIDKNALGNF